MTAQPRVFRLDWKSVPRQASRKDNESRTYEWNERLAHLIRAYWARHGFTVEVEIVPMSKANTHVPYGLKTNLVNGLPPGVVAIP